MITDAFQFSRLPLIHFGKGKLGLLPGLIKKLGTNIILVTGKRSFMGSGEAANLLNMFWEEKITFQRAVIEGEPSPEAIDIAVRGLEGEGFNVVVGIGGGSVLDAGKAISAMMHLSGSVRDFLEGVGRSEHPGTKISYIAVPTTSGTGSEATKNAVISSVGESGFKRSLRHENFVPDIALVDPMLTISCPEEITAASGADALTQLLEAYLSVKASPYTDALALEGVRAVTKSLLRCVADGSDIEARTGMAFAALTSGICLANAGLGSVHGFASSIGGMFRIPHGVVCGSLMAEANRVNVRELRNRRDGDWALRKYSCLGRIVSGYSGRTDDYYIDSFIEYLTELVQELKLPLLSEYGIGTQDILKICDATDIKSNPVALSRNNLSEIMSGRL
jgi:alcohol dehydrogenase class IV